MLNILWLNHRDPKHPKAGGAERTIYEVAKRFVKQGNKVTVYCPKWKGSLDEEIMEGIKIIRKGNNLTTHIFLPIFLIKQNFDVIISDLAHGIPWISPVFLNSGNIVFFRHLHARSLPGQVNFILAKIITIFEKLYPLIYKDIKIVTESSSSVEDLIRLGFNKNNIVRIPPGVDLNLFSPGKKSEIMQLIYFGGLRKYKRPECALKVYEELNIEIPDIKLVITGSGPSLKKMKEAIKTKNYNIEFIGKVDYKELSEIIKKSWINLHFSITEGWGYSILESSASGTPTIALRVPGVVDTIKDNFNGFLVNEISEFKDKILYIVKNENLFAKNSRKFAENFTWEKTVDSWYELLRND
jgi:glycosyltransferase involved in cell wall biosynthesis